MLKYYCNYKKCVHLLVYIVTVVLYHIAWNVKCKTFLYLWRPFESLVKPMDHFSKKINK